VRQRRDYARRDDVLCKLIRCSRSVIMMQQHIA
jgi:hypothetical protein